MKHPECSTPEACRFIHEGGFSTCMYSPIEYDRNGKAVGGGRNTRSRGIRCNACHKSWGASGSELAWAQGRVEWRPEPSEERTGGCTPLPRQ